MTAPTVASEASVVLGFRAENVRSFRDELQLSTLATAMSDLDAVRHVRWREGGKPLRVVPVVAIYGANGSGKSNVLKAMDDMRTHVLHSFRGGRPRGGIPRRPFELDEAARTSPSRFEIDIVLRGVRWEYGFVLDDERVIEEWAYRYPRGRASMVFHRHGDDVELGADERAKSRAVVGVLRSNALFISTAASAAHPLLLPLYEWFERNLLLAEADSRPYRQALTQQMLDDPDKKSGVLELLRAADLGVTGARKHQLDPVMRDRLQRVVRILMGEEDDPDGAAEVPTFEELGVRLVHRGSDGEVELDAADESLGTRVWFGLVGPVLQALAEGSVFLADELDASLHPALVTQLVRLFQDESTNPRRAQLIFNTHDATLLGDSSADRLLGRDQVWFTEKTQDGGSRLYSLVDLSPRKEESLSRRYMSGRYGSVPILSRQEFASVAELVTAGAND